MMITERTGKTLSLTAWWSSATLDFCTLSVGSGVEVLLSLEMLMSGLGSRQHRASSLHVTLSLTNLIGGAEDIQRHLFDTAVTHSRPCLQSTQLQCPTA